MSHYNLRPATTSVGSPPVQAPQPQVLFDNRLRRGKEDSLRIDFTTTARERNPIRRTVVYPVGNFVIISRRKNMTRKIINHLSTFRSFCRLSRLCSRHSFVALVRFGSRRTSRPRHSMFDSGGDVDIRCSRTATCAP